MSELSMKKIMIMAGEASGDLHGSNLAREIRKADPSIVLYGVGSKQMKDAGVQCWRMLQRYRSSASLK